LDFKEAKILVVFFTCNHCPFVTESDETTRDTVDMYKGKSVAFIGINAIMRRQLTLIPEAEYRC